MRDRFDAIAGDVTFALRQLRRSPVLAIAAILCFALGIGVPGHRDLRAAQLHRPRPGWIPQDPIERGEQ